jgi:hypothetical protein
MGRNQILAIMFCSLAFLSYENTGANAGWFGPSNADECLLEKMKGQLPGMFEIASAACIYQFACNAKFTEEFRKCLTNDVGSQWCARYVFHYCNDP